MRVMSHVRASNPARICLGLDPEAGESPKTLFDDAGVVQVVSEDQAAARVGQSCGVCLLSAGRRLRLQAVQIGCHSLDRGFSLGNQPFADLQFRLSSADLRL